MSKHTKGPWKVVDREVFLDQSVYPQHVVGGPDELVVCYLESQYAADTGVPTSARKEAVARLIAASPDLLEALEFCAEQIENEGMQGWGVGAQLPDFVAAIERARAAIAKARGE